MFVVYTPCTIFSHLLFVVTLGVGKLQRGRIFISYEGVQCTKLLRRPDRSNTAFAGHKSQRGQLIESQLRSPVCMMILNSYYSERMYTPQLGSLIGVIYNWFVGN